MVELGRVSRSSFYRFDDAGQSRIRDMDLRDAIQTDCVGVAQLRASADHRRAAPSGMDGEPQAGLPVDARGQSAVRAASGSSSSPPIPITRRKVYRTWRGT